MTTFPAIQAFTSTTREDTRRWLTEAGQTKDPAQRQQLIDQAVLANLPAADALARRYHSRSVPLDDLIQVARLSLVTAANRFDPEHGSNFLAYASPTITGDLRKYFRDHGWSIRPPRRVQEAHLKARIAVVELAQSLGREPLASEIAEAIEVDEATVVQAQIAGEGYASLSLDFPTSVEDDETLGDTLGCIDAEFARAELRLMLRPLLATLAERDRKVLSLRYLDGMTQQEVGEEIGISQMQVSRILSRILDELRRGLGIDAAAA